MLGQSCPSSCPRRARTGNGIVPCLPSPGGSPCLHTLGHTLSSQACWKGELLCVSGGLGKSGSVPPFTAVLPCVCWHIALMPPCPPCHCLCSNCMEQHWLLIAGDGCGVEGGTNEAGWFGSEIKYMGS